MPFRRLGPALGAAALIASFAAGPAAFAAPQSGPGPHTGPTLSVGGAVSDPATYTLAQLAALPTETVSIPLPGLGSGSVSATGVSLDALVTLAEPILPAAKNALLRATVTATGSFGQSVTFALGELDPNFGDHDAVVVLSVAGIPLLTGPALYVPGDTGLARDLPEVKAIDVAVNSPAVTVPPEAGALVVEDGPRTVVLSATQLSRLPSETKTVSFIGPTGTQTHTETGPTLDTVLAAARIPLGFNFLNTWAAAVGSDGYIAVVTPGEAVFGNRPLLISLVEDGVALTDGPRLITDGDVKGGRYVSGMDDLVVGQSAGAGLAGRI